MRNARIGGSVVLESYLSERDTELTSFLGLLSELAESPTLLISYTSHTVLEIQQSSLLSTSTFDRGIHAVDNRLDIWDNRFTLSTSSWKLRQWMRFSANGSINRCTQPRETYLRCAPSTHWNMAFSLASFQICQEFRFSMNSGRPKPRHQQDQCNLSHLVWKKNRQGTLGWRRAKQCLRRRQSLRRSLFI